MCSPHGLAAGLLSRPSLCPGLRGAPTRAAVPQEPLTQDVTMDWLPGAGHWAGDCSAPVRGSNPAWKDLPRAPASTPSGPGPASGGCWEEPGGARARSLFFLAAGEGPDYVILDSSFGPISIPRSTSSWPGCGASQRQWGVEEQEPGPLKGSGLGPVSGTSRQHLLVRGGPAQGSCRGKGC